MGYVELSQIEEMVPFPGFRGRMVHTDRMTLAYWSVTEGSALPQHSHHHEQVVNVLEGTLELVVDGTEHTLEEGDVYVIPPNAEHSATAVTSCRLLDVFSPVRDDYR